MGIYFDQNNKMVFDCRDGAKVINSNCGPSFYNVKYGLLYNWWAATGTSSNSIASTGWHVPSSTEFQTLSTYLGGNTVSGGKIKEVGTDYWLTPNSGATNEVAFNARGGGLRQGYSFSSFQSQCIFRTTTDYDAASCLGGGWISYNSTLWTGIGSLYTKRDGHTIRLLKDLTSLLNGQTSTYTGNDGKIYHTICIDTQEWLASNLAETQYRDNSSIPEVTDSTTWYNLTTGAMCAYDNNWIYVGD
jgi:uncharacterized protein (TIGR02145 family)